jgi:hypothetical protein
LGPNISTTLTRSVTRLKSIFITFEAPRNAAYGYNEREVLTHDIVNSFYHPMQGTYDWFKELEIQVQIGGKVMPVYPIRSVAETFTHLKEGDGDVKQPIPFNEHRLLKNI